VKELGNVRDYPVDHFSPKNTFDREPPPFHRGIEDGL
jgi:hypothetical protein